MYTTEGIHKRVLVGFDIYGYKCSCGTIYHYYGCCPVCKEKTDLKDEVKG